MVAVVVVVVVVAGLEVVELADCILEEAGINAGCLGQRDQSPGSIM